MPSRRTGALVAAVVAALCALTFASGASAASGGGCKLKGTAAFTPGLNTTSQPFTYSFGGDLTGCQSTEAGAPATGVVQAGGNYTDPVSGKAYVLPNSTGTGGCASSTTQGLALISWSDGTRTLTQYSTSGAAAAVVLDGTVVDSTTLQPVDPLDPPLTVTTTRYQGSSSHGLLAFEATPTDCQTGVTTAGIEGIVGLGKQ
ncbi:MAG: hypothetical protein QOE69_2255 [Thermoleophilaceae bacterium]|jgi:hypothetical protein|nr:hypothetical protein [Thermoleophilaceae bacterium]